LVSKTALHAIRALCALAKLPKGKRAGAAFIAEAIGAPPNYLGKLLQGLSRQGLVESKKGLNGGFCLAVTPESITLKDVVDPIDQTDRWSECLLGMNHLLQEVSISDLVGTGADLSGDFLEENAGRRPRLAEIQKKERAS
jgi:Rrf2 family protein